MYTDWSIKGPAFANCNCAWGCPCQFNAAPTYGNCLAMSAVRIDQGHFADVPLDGLCLINTYAWPKAVHEGNGTHQVIIDQRADDAQRAALAAIAHGEETAPGGTVFQVYSTTVSTVLDTVFAPIEFACDIPARTAHVVVPDVIESTGEPIRNPVTGAEHRARVVMPEGFEYTEAEYGSGTTKATGAIALDFTDSYGQFCTYHFTQNGVVR